LWKGRKRAGKATGLSLPRDEDERFKSDNPVALVCGVHDGENEGSE
jgi:hypothetical protein